MKTTESVLLARYIDRKSKKVVESRKELLARFEYLSFSDQKKIIITRGTAWCMGNIVENLITEQGELLECNVIDRLSNKVIINRDERIEVEWNICVQPLLHDDESEQEGNGQKCWITIRDLEYAAFDDCMLDEFVDF